MTFREINHKYIEPAAQWLMILGIIALCQPWSAFLHEWSVLIMLIGFFGFIISIHIPRPESAGEAEVDSMQRGAGHG